MSKADYKNYTQIMKRIFSLVLTVLLMHLNGVSYIQISSVPRAYAQPSSDNPVSDAAKKEEPGLPSDQTEGAPTEETSSAGVSPAEEETPEAILVDLDLKDADMKDIARALSRISGKNIIVNDEVKVKVAMRVKGMNWREALLMILETYGLTMLEKDNYIIITTFEKRRAIEESGDLQTKVVSCNFIDVLAIQKTLSTMLTKRGKMETDSRTNSLVITDIPEALDSIEQVALQLDTKTPQVMIETMMLTVKLNDDEKLGIDWDLTHKSRPERELSQHLALGGAAGADYLWQIKYGKTLFTWSEFSLTLEMLLQEQRAEILANPRVMTLDNMAATIDLTEQVPYLQQTTSTESSSSVTSVQFKDVPVKLIVKPHVTKDNHIVMNVQTEQSYRSGVVDGQPIIDSRKAETNVIVRDGETLVIGGLRKKEETTTVNKLPILGDIPLVGTLFKKTVKASVDTELIILVTPYIASEGRLARIERQNLEEMDYKTGFKNELTVNNDLTLEDGILTAEEIDFIAEENSDLTAEDIDFITEESDLTIDEIDSIMEEGPTQTPE
jgi:type IV pilus assembly protein PilQ